MTAAESITRVGAGNPRGNGCAPSTTTDSATCADAPLRIWTLRKGTREAAIDLRHVPGLDAEIVLTVDGELACMIAGYLRWRWLLARAQLGRIVRPCSVCGRAWSLRRSEVRLVSGRVVVPSRCKRC